MDEAGLRIKYNPPTRPDRLVEIDRVVTKERTDSMRTNSPAGLAPAFTRGIALAGVLGVCVAFASAADTVNVTTTVEFGEDLGQNFGTLFEARDDRGRVRFGAGFMGVYNSKAAADRYTVQFYVRPPAVENEFAIERLPRPSPDCGLHMFDLDGTLYAWAYIYERKLRSWDPATRSWKPDPSPITRRMRLGKGLLQFADNLAEYNGKRILTPPKKGRYLHFYYARGTLIFFHTHKVSDDEKASFTHLYAVPWRPGDAEADLAKAVMIPLTYPGETPFTHGQLGDDILTSSNMGGVYLFADNQWRVLRKPQRGVSFQLYSMLNYHDKLLLSQYPTGELFEFNGKTIKHLKGRPPKLEGVSGSVREAQTMAIYRGDLFVGVWPWGEVWRYDRDADRWHSMGRLFTHPELSDKWAHPYEQECNDMKIRSNEWGQRVTGMLPLGPDLMLSTSAYGAWKWQLEKYPFFDKEKLEEYGSVVRMTLPGNLAAAVKWKPGPTELQFVVHDGRLAIRQDGRELAATKLDAAIARDPDLASAKITWAKGVFGPFGGKSVAGSAK